MDKFAEIRPYSDDEVHAVIERILNDDESINAVAQLKLSHWPNFLLSALRPLMRFVLKRRMRDVNSVADFQVKIENLLAHMVEATVTDFSVSGLDRLDKSAAYIYISNHRDITLDPAFVNLALYRNGQDTVRIAIGDNLLTKDFATDLMRINKSFIVKRSETAPRKLLAALRLLSQYIYHSITEDKHSVWIAQREGRAKDGVDKTDEAILKMLAIHAGLKANFAETMQPLHVVPVSISYEYDPCDELKANELNELEVSGEYIKADQEDLSSIAKGIADFKGHIHLSFGDVVSGGFETAEDLSILLDRIIVENYVLHPSNFLAYKKLYGEFPSLPVGSGQKVFSETDFAEEKEFFEKRIESIRPALRERVLHAYANPIAEKMKLVKG